VVESIIGSRFNGRVIETTTFGNYPAVIPEVEGTAHICGRQEFLVDPTIRSGTASSCADAQRSPVINAHP
jgi:proline racemase